MARRPAATALAIALAIGGVGCEEAARDPGDVTVARAAVSSATEGWAINYPKQRKIFFAHDRLWLFYSDGADAVVRTSADGRAFSDAALVREEMVFGHRIGLAFDGAFFHYACSSALEGEDVLYRRGLPRDDGTIAWDAEQVVLDVPAGQNAMYPKVVVDSDGRPWVTFMRFTGGFMTAPQEAVVVRSSRDDGIWETAPGSPFVLVAGSVETYPDALGVALASGGTYWVYDRDGEDFYRGRRFADGAWGAEETITETRQRYALFDAIAIGDEVHLAYGGGTIRHRARAADGSWGREVVVAGGGASGHVALSDAGDALIVTWLDLDGDRVVQRERARDGSWGPLLLAVDAAPEGGLAGARLGINLGALEDATAGPFRAAVATTVGSGPPFTLLVATRARADAP